MSGDFAEIIQRIRERNADKIDEAYRRGLVAEPPSFDPIAWRVEQAEGLIQRRVPSLFRDAVLEFDGIRRWVDRLVADPATTPHLLLMGNIGAGKTSNAFAAIREAALAYARSGRGLRWEAITHVEFNAAIRPGGSAEPEVVICRWQQADLLLFDDLTSGRLTDWSDEALMRVVDHRIGARLPMIVTCNADPRDLEAALGERLASRLRDSFRIAFDGPDRRGGAA